MKKILGIFCLLTSAQPVIAADFTQQTFTSGGLTFYVIDSNENQTKRSRDAQGIVKGLEVKNATLNITGNVSGDLVVKQKSETMTFDDDEARVLRIGGGYWLLSYPDGTDLLQKTSQLKQNNAIDTVNIHVTTQLRQPN